MLAREPSGWCRRCKAYRPLCRPLPDHRKHALASLLTAGLWLPGWAAAWLWGRSAALRCGNCGSQSILRERIGRAGAYDLYRPA
jgi:hypothetical protein